MTNDKSKDIRPFSRSDTSRLGTWWWTIDKSILAALIGLAFIGLLFLLSAAPVVSERIGYGPYFFIKKQLVFLALGGGLALFISILSPLHVRRISGIVFLSSLLLLFLVPFLGTEIKGAKRWIYFFGFSVQPSEFIKPAFFVISAYLLALFKKRKDKRILGILGALFFIILLMILMQPDVGMAMTLLFVFFVQIFVAGLPWIYVAAGSALGVAVPVFAYFSFSHVRARVSSFLAPDTEASFQVSKGFEAYASGRLFGKGIGEGTVKKLIPDAHTDFIMAVAAEEYGLFFCLIMLFLFAFIVVKGFFRLLSVRNIFIILSVSALLVQFFMQMFINIASTLRLIPPKGMTLPFVSYGGSSLIALCFMMGIVLALTRKNAEDPEFD